MLFSLCAVIVDRRYVLSLRRDENDRSAEAVLYSWDSIQKLQ